MLVLLPGSPTAAEPAPAIVTVADGAHAYRAQREQQIVDEFTTLLSLPNVSSDRAAIRRNADHIAAYLAEYGLESRLLEVEDGPPAVYAERMVPGAERTIMIYVHYDGQPVQLENWASDPWRPILRDGRVEDGGAEVPLSAPFDPDHRIFARSAGDDKAPVIAIPHALAALDAIGIAPAVNLKFFFEGEEEIGSPNLREMLSKHADLLAADLWLFCDGPMHPSGRPQLAYGVRGAMGLHLTLYGASRPLHSGHYGNWAPNPLAMASHLLASMRDEQGNVLIEGFADEVREPTASELAALDRIPAVDIALRQDLHLGRTEGEGRRIERAILSPALNFRGIRGGGVRETSRNVIVPEVTVSLGVRLVPDQTVPHVQAAIARHLEDQGYHVVYEEPTPALRAAHRQVAWVEWGGGYPALRTSFDHPVAQRLAEVLDEWSGGALIQLPTMGGSLPLYLIEEVLGAPILILPVANHDNNQHAENENLRIGNLWNAIAMYAVTFASL